jgi:hypothetical protein
MTTHARANCGGQNAAFPAPATLYGGPLNLGSLFGKQTAHPEPPRHQEKVNREELINLDD